MFEQAMQNALSKAFDGRMNITHQDTVGIVAKSHIALRDLRAELFEFGFKPLGADSLLSQALNMVNAYRSTGSTSQIDLFISMVEREKHDDETNEEAVNSLKREVSGAFKHLIDNP